MNTTMTRIHFMFILLLQLLSPMVIGRCQFLCSKNPDLIGFFKIKPRHPDGLKITQIWVDKNSNGSPAPTLLYHSLGQWFSNHGTHTTSGTRRPSKWYARPYCSFTQTQHYVFTYQVLLIHSCIFVYFP